MVQRSIQKGAAILALSALFLSGCVATPPSTVQKDTIKLGVIAPLTGDAAPYGEVTKNIITMVVDNLNAKGGINGQQVEVDMEDGQCNGKDAGTAMQKLVNVTKAQVVIGGICSSETLSMAPIGEQNKVVTISGGSSSPKITDAGTYTFRTYPSDTGKGKVLAQYAVDQKFKKIGVIAEQSDYALAIKDVFVDYVKVLAKQDVAVEVYTADATDVRTQLTKLKSAGVDALFVDPQSPAKAQLILQELQELKFAPKLLTQEVLGTDTETLTKFKEMVEGMITADVIPPDTAAYTKFKADYKAKFGKDVNFESIASGVYDATMLSIKAVSLTGNDGTKIRDYLSTVKDYAGMVGTFSFDVNGDPTLTHSLMVVKDAKAILYVNPAAKAEEKKAETTEKATEAKK